MAPSAIQEESIATTHVEKLSALSWQAPQEIALGRKEF